MRLDKLQKHSLIVQGGGQKGAFAAGVLDCFKKKHFDPFSLYIGTSAGALNVAAFVAGQTGLGLDFILNYTTKQRFFDFNKFVKNEQPMDLDWAFKFVDTGDFPLDIEKGSRELGHNKEALACITHVGEMKDYYYPIFSDNWFDVLRATCAIPMLYFHDIEFDGGKWVDGGVTATVPVQESYRRGIKNMVVITTEPISSNLHKHEPPKAIEKLKLDLGKDIQQFISKHNLHGYRDKLLDIHHQFTDKVAQMTNELKMPSFGDAPDWMPDKHKLSQLVAQQAEKFKSSKAYSKNMRMLVQHYSNHTAVKEFMSNPPQDVTIYEIAPEVPLLCHGLLSDKDDILHDYQVGLLAGSQFLEDVGYIDNGATVDCSR